MKLLVLCDDTRDGHGLRAALQEQFREHKQPIAWLTPGGILPAEFDVIDEPVLVIDCLGSNGNPTSSPLLANNVFAQWLARCDAGEWIWLLLSDSRVFSTVTKRRFLENDAPAPVGENGKKLLARERFIAAAAKRHIILRTGPIIASRGENLLTRLLAQLRAGEAVLSDTQRFCPTPAADVARVIAALHDQLDCGANGWGIYHYESADAVSGYEFAEVVLAAAAQYWRLAENIAQSHRASAVGEIEIDVEDIFPLLNCHRLRDTFGIQQLPWRKAIPALLKQIHSNDSAEAAS